MYKETQLKERDGIKEKFFERLQFDFYGELLSPRQKTILDYYYNDDYALCEIGEILKMTRQGVHDAFRRANRMMTEYEEKLGLVERYLSHKKLLSEVTKRIQELSEDNAIRENPKILSDVLALKLDIEEIIGND